MEKSYRSIVKKHFSEAVIVADRFHVIRLVNHCFLKAWQQLDPVGRKNRGLLSLMRRHEHHLDLEQKSRLKQYLIHRPVLFEICQFKQNLVRILLLKGQRKHVLRPHIHDLVKMIAQLNDAPIEALRTLGQTLERWSEEIGRLLRFSKSNGITEGFSQQNGNDLPKSLWV